MSEEADDPPFFGPLLLATRPKTLLAAVVPVWLGFSLSHAISGHFDGFLFAVTLVATLLIQIATNFFNDAIDFKKGADREDRLGPSRMAGSGALSPESLIIAGVTIVMMAVAVSLLLVAARGWPIIVIGIPSLYFTFGYTGGPFPLAYRGLGELFVLIFFGFVAVAGAAFVNGGVWLPEAILLGGQVGLLATVLIAVNNTRDIDADRAARKHTLAARFGLGFARCEVAFCCVAPYLLGALWWLAFGRPLVALLPLLGLGLSAGIAFKVFRSEPGAIYNKFLALSALALLNFAVLVTAALYIA